VLYLRGAGWTDADEFTILTKAGEIRPRITGPDSATIAMGRAAFTSDDYPSGGEDGTGTVESAGREWRFQHVSIGNPQCVIDAGDQVEDLDLAAIGPGIERSDLFPNRTNVAFMRVDGSGVRARIFERGVGETLSSGTGASGAAVAAFLRGAPSPLTVRLDGGELAVEVSEELEVTLTGTASPVYRGELSDELVRALSRGQAP
jgi:diaminopimelate epimerase